MQSIRYFIEAVLLYALYGFFKILPVESASNLGGWLGRVIGPLLGASGKAERHLSLAMPDLSQDQKKTIIVQMWDNLGRVIAEYPHLRHIAGKRTTIESDIDLNIYKGSDKGIVFVAAHIGNWEIGCIAPYLQTGLEIDSTYRAPNNPWVADFLLRLRTLNGVLKSYPKSRQGGMSLIKAMKQKRNIVILIDQKYNEGIAVPFFGQDAMTNPIFVQLGQKYGLDVIPVHILRTGSARFCLRIEEPLRLEDDDGRARSEYDVIKDAHAVLEGWIREQPGQWLWLHRRWKD